MANTNSQIDSLRLGPSPAIGSLGYYEMFPPSPPPASLGPAPAGCDCVDCYDRLQTPPSLSSTRSVPPAPTKPLPARLPTPPATPRPFDITALRLTMELEAMKTRVAELEARVEKVEKRLPPSPETPDEYVRCDCSMCVVGIA